MSIRTPFTHSTSVPQNQPFLQNWHSSVMAGFLINGLKQGQRIPDGHVNTDSEFWAFCGQPSALFDYLGISLQSINAGFVGGVLEAFDQVAGHHAGLVNRWPFCARFSPYAEAFAGIDPDTLAIRKNGLQRSIQLV